MAEDLEEELVEDLAEELAEELAEDTPTRLPHAVKPLAYVATTTNCQKSVPRILSQVRALGYMFAM